MALTIVFMLFFSIILAIRNYRSKYSLLFILMVLGMSISMFTIVSEIYNSSNYLIPSIYLYSGIEYRIYLFLSNIFKLPLSNLLLLRNFGIITYLIALLLFAIFFSKTVKSSNQKVHPLHKIIRYILLTAYPIVYFYFYHPDTAYKIYLKRYSILGVDKQNLWMNFISVVDIIMVALAFFYLIYPIGFLIRNYIKNKITFFSEQLLGLAFSLGLLNSIFFFVFFTGYFKPSVYNVFKSGFWRYKLSVVVPSEYATLMPALSLIILLIILYITIKFKTDNLINGLKERAIKKNLNSLNTNLKDVLHSNKNVMFNMKILAQEAINAYGTPEGLERLQKISSLSDLHIEAISKALNNIRELKVRTINHNFLEAIEAAIEGVSLPKNIELIKVFHSEELYCNFDMYHMTQVISNLLSNAVDAINSREGTNAHIIITVDRSKDWIYFSMKDDGCGIPKKLQKKIFNPYFSTKSKQNNWGIGLSYVFRVITSHCGHIRIKSKQGEYTNVEILLPRRS